MSGWGGDVWACRTPSDMLSIRPCDVYMCGGGNETGLPLTPSAWGGVGGEARERTASPAVCCSFAHRWQWVCRGRECTFCSEELWGKKQKGKKHEHEKEGEASRGEKAEGEESAGGIAALCSRQGELSPCQPRH